MDIASCRSVNRLEPHPFRDDGSSSNNNTDDVWAAYAELQKAYAALQASELSASTHLQQTSGLLTSSTKKCSDLERQYSKAKDKCSKAQRERDQAKERLSDVLTDSSELHAALASREAEYTSLKTKAKALKQKYDKRAAAQEAETKRVQDNAAYVLSEFDDVVLQSAEMTTCLKDDLLEVTNISMERKERSLKLERHVKEMTEAQESVFRAHKDQLRQATQEQISAQKELDNLRVETNSFHGRAEQAAKEVMETKREYEISLKKIKKISNEMEMLKKKNEEMKCLNEKIEKELKNMKTKQMENDQENEQLKQQLMGNHQRETDLMRELTSVRESLELEREKNVSTLEKIKLATEKERHASSMSSSSSLKLLQAELEPLQAELRRLSPLETELAELRKTNETMSRQMIQSHEREDALRKELTKARNDMASMMSGSGSEDSAAKLELETFKQELADVRAKQMFAVNEVKVLMAKLANQNGGSSKNIAKEEQGRMDFIDENLKKIKLASTKKEKRGGAQFVSRGNKVHRRRK